MGTRSTAGLAKTIDCQTCGQEYTAMCSYRQGRCPHHLAMITLSSVKTRFTNLFNFLRGKQNGTN